jgi:ADP-ribose pyrophosphatase YjhB (NUDIX family)
MRIMISEDKQFIFRVAGIFLRDQSVLLHRAEDDVVWALPGGGCDFHEDTKSTLVREMLEELNAEVEVISLAFTVENFFEVNSIKAHEIGFYYLARFLGQSEKFYKCDTFEGIEDRMEGVKKHRLYFKWIPFKSLSEYDIMILPRKNGHRNYAAINCFSSYCIGV